jgi:hypothetical protein
VPDWSHYDVSDQQKLFDSCKELKKGDAVKICLSRFDFEFLDSASRRFEVSYDEESGKRRDKIRGQRPYLLDELDDFERLWKTISEELPAVRSRKQLVSLRQNEKNGCLRQTILFSRILCTMSSKT